MARAPRRAAGGQAGAGDLDQPGGVVEHPGGHRDQVVADRGPVTSTAYPPPGWASSAVTGTTRALLHAAGGDRHRHRGLVQAAGRLRVGQRHQHGDGRRSGPAGAARITGPALAAPASPGAARTAGTGGGGGDGADGGDHTGVVVPSGRVTLTLSPFFTSVCWPASRAIGHHRAGRGGGQCRRARRRRPAQHRRRARPGDPGRARQEHRLAQRQRPGHRQPEVGLQQLDGVGGLGAEIVPARTRAQRRIARISQPHQGRVQLGDIRAGHALRQAPPRRDAPVQQHHGGAADLVDHLPLTHL